MNPKERWPNAKNPREERRAIRKRMNSDLKRAVALSSMAEKNVIPVRIGDGSTDFFQVQSYKKCTALELHNAGFKGVL